MPPVLSTLREDFKQQHAERGGSFERPPIPFIPDKSRVDEAQEHEVTLRVSPDGNGAEKNNVIKKKVPVFSDGTPEDILFWQDELRQVLKRKPCTSAESKFDMTEVLLAGDALVHWKEFIRMETESPSRTVDTGKLVAAPGRTEGTFEASLKKLVKHYFPKNAARIQKNYMRNHLRQPREMKAKLAVSRLRDMNGMLAKFPGAGATVLEEDELGGHFCPHGIKTLSGHSESL